MWKSKPEWTGRETEFDGIHHFIAIIEDCRIIYLNAAGSLLLDPAGGRNLLGRLINDFINPDYVGILELGLESLVDEADGLPLKMIQSDETEVDARMWVSHWENSTGSGDRFMMEVHDLTAHMRAARILREREQRLSEIISTVADGIITVDGDNMITTFNPAAAHIFGYEANEVMGMSVDDLVPGLKDTIETDPHRAAHEMYVERKNGSMVVVELAGNRLPDDRGSTLTWIARDISARKVVEESKERHLMEAEDSRQIMEDQAMTMVAQAEEYYKLMHTAESADMAKTKFLANMSHELRTPLNAIIGFSEVMKAQMFGPMENKQYVEYSNDIYESGTYLLELINNILDLSKVEAEAMEIYDEILDIRSIVRETLTMIRERAAKSRTSVFSDIPEQFPQIRADRIRIKQIILNLLTNAVKFSPVGSAIDLEFNVDESHGAIIRVVDHGNGVAAEDIETVLTPFGQVTDMMTREQEGTGLGLPLCKSFMELHGGTLLFESKLGEGTTVTLNFPPDRTVFYHGQTGIGR